MHKRKVSSGLDRNQAFDPRPRADIHGSLQGYDQLLERGNLTPLLRQQIMGVRDYFKASLTTSLGVLDDLSDELHPLQLQVDQCLKELYSNPNVISTMISDIWALRKLLYLRLTVDYDPRYKDNVETYTAEQRTGTYGRYLEDPGKWISSANAKSGHDTKLHNIAVERTKEVAKEALIGTAYATKQVCIFFG